MKGGGFGSKPETTTAVSVSVAVGLGVAAVAGLGVGMLAGSGMLAVGAVNTLRGAKPHLKHEDIEWDDQGRIKNWNYCLKIAQQGGISPHLRAEIWPFLLGVFSPTSTDSERLAELTRLRNLYTKLVLVCEELDCQIEATRREHENKLKKINKYNSSPQKPPPLQGNLASFSEAHRIIVLDAVRTDMKVQPSDFRSQHRIYNSTRNYTAHATTTSNKSMTITTERPLHGAASTGSGAINARAPSASSVDHGNAKDSLLQESSLSLSLIAAPEKSGSSVIHKTASSGSSIPSATGPSSSSAAAAPPIAGASSPSTPAISASAVSKNPSNDTSNGTAAKFINSPAPTAVLPSLPPPTHPTLTVLPVSVGDALPELMYRDPPQPAPSDAVAAGQLPVWRSSLAVATIDQAPHVTPAIHRLMIRLVNILSAYAVHDPENGYCQGMSDLAAVFVQLIDDDALAFACFERFMRDARQNFRHDEHGIKQQLMRVAKILQDTDPKLYKKLQSLGCEDCTFAYRMVVVLLRRELPLGETLTLWDVKWCLEAVHALEMARGGGEADEKKENTSGLTVAASSSRVVDAKGGADDEEVDGGAFVVLPAANEKAHHRPATTTSPLGAPSSSLLSSTVASMDAATRQALSHTVHGSGPMGSGSLYSTNGLHGNKLLPLSPPPPDFILQFVAATVRAQRAKVLHECRDADDVLRLFNSLEIDFWAVLVQAQKQHKAFAQGIAVLQRLP